MSQPQLDRATQIKMAEAELTELNRRHGIMVMVEELLKGAKHWADKVSDPNNEEPVEEAMANSMACLAQSQILLHSINLTDIQNKIAAFEMYLKQIQSPILQANLVPPNMGGR